MVAQKTYIECVAFSPDGRFIIAGGFDKTIQLLNPENGNEIRFFQGHTGRVTSVVFSSDGQFFASTGGDPDRSIRIWKVETGEQIHSIQRTFYLD